MKSLIIRICFILVLLCVNQLSNSGAAVSSNDLPKASPVKAITPPLMTKREITKSSVLPGKQITLIDKTNEFTLFLPKEWNAAASDEVTLTIHFLGGVRMVIDEHLRRGLKEPLLVASFKGLSSVYRVPFEDRERFARLIKLVEQTIKENGAPEKAHITTVDISSASAGYGAVREILKSPEYVKIVRRVVLCDSIYADLAPAVPNQPRRPADHSIDPWLPFARAAMRGEKTFVLTHSSNPVGSYASTGECAAALIQKLRAPVSARRAAGGPDDFSLRYRSDVGNFHIWGYGGIGGAAHGTHLQHLADTWMALDAVGKP